MLPNFIIIGAMKCGTTSLHFYLNQHPQIFMSQKKELNFFSRYWDFGVDWYSSKFPNKENMICGEASPSYSKFQVWPNVPQRIHAIIPHAKIIYLVRNPIERIRSQYVHFYSSDKENRSLELAIKEDLSLIHI